MKKVILIFLIVVTGLITVGGLNSQWIVQSSGVTVNLYDVKFINRYTGWAVGENGTILKTTNAGNNWNLIPNPSYNMGKILWVISVIDNNYAYVVGAHSTYLKTTNSGNTWIIIRNGPYGSGMGFTSLFYLNRDTGWVYGDWRFLKTKDGGITFDSIASPEFSLYDMYFKDFNTGIICGEGIVMKSTNAGMLWFNTNVPTNGYFYIFKKLSVINSQYIWIVGNGNIFYKSTNFATTWDSIAYLPAYPPSVMYCSHFSSINTGWAGGSYGYLYKTTDGGLNWIRQATGTDQRFWGSIWFYNDSIGWGVGGAGKIMHTTTGGQSIVNISANENEISESFRLEQNYPNPFNNQTIIDFEIKENGNISIEIFDIAGRKVKELVKGYYKTGKYSIKYNAENLNSGIYFYRLKMEKTTLTKKFILMK
jgi:photosystem II stability/assembly factor-like uncharacterized protein